MRKITKVLTVMGFAAGLAAAVAELILLVFQKPVIELFGGLSDLEEKIYPMVSIVRMAVSTVMIVLFFDITMKKNAAASKKICLANVIYFFAGNIVFSIASSIETNILYNTAGTKMMAANSALVSAITGITSPMVSLSSISVCIVLGLQIADSQNRGHYDR